MAIESTLPVLFSPRLQRGENDSSKEPLEPFQRFLFYALRSENRCNGSEVNTDSEPPAEATV